jgi:hypothetical protein
MAKAVATIALMPPRALPDPQRPRPFGFTPLRAAMRAKP